MAVKICPNGTNYLCINDQRIRPVSLFLQGQVRNSEDPCPLIQVFQDGAYFAQPIARKSSLKVGEPTVGKFNNNSLDSGLAFEWSRIGDLPQLTTF